MIPGCNFGKKDRIWRLPLTWPGYVCFRTVWARTPIEISPGLLEWGAEQWMRVQGMYDDRLRVDCTPGFRESYLGPIEDTGTEDSGPKLTPPQRGGVEFLVKYGRAGLEDPMGNGKSPQIIRSLQVQQAMTGSALPALLICRGATLLGWRDKLAAWAPELSVSVVMGTATKRRKALEAEADVCLIAWPNVRLHSRLAPYGSQRLKRCEACGGTDPKTKPAMCEAHEKELNLRRWGTIIADEAHAMKDPKSKQTRAVQYLAHHAEFFWPATGTLVTGTVADPWPIMHAMSPQGFPSRSRFLDLFAVKDWNWFGGAEFLGLRPEHENSFHSIVQPYWRRIPREIARPFQPPRLEPEFRYPEMTAAQKRVYDQLSKEITAELEGRTLVTPSAITKFTRLCQVASSMIEVVDGEDAQGFTIPKTELALPSNKADDLLEFIEDNPGQLVVAANSPRLIELAERKLRDARITFGKIVGGMGPSAMYDANQLFLNGQVQVMFINAAGSEGIDLQVADTIYFIQPDPSFVSREQKIGRIDRFGQKRGVRVVHALSPVPVDKRLYLLGCEKEERHQMVAQDAGLMRWVLSEGAEVPT